VKESLFDNIVKHFPSKKPFAVNFAGSSISEMGMTHLSKVLKPNKTNNVLLIDLNLKQTFLSSKQLHSLKEALRVNTTLLKLNLSHNYINDTQGSFFIQFLADNSHIKELNLSHNLLGLKTCKMIH
jgi:Ran GTPase-activating protein (RanGAP) involved in mRNA processing and transport